MRKIYAIIILITCFFTGYSQDFQKIKQFNMPGEVMVDFGFNFLRDKPAVLGTDFFPSRAFGIYYTYGFILGNRVSLNTGFGWFNDRIGWTKNVNFILGKDDKLTFDTLKNKSVSKNLLIFNYLEIPIEFRFFIMPTTNGEGFFIAVGGTLGYNFENYTKIEYTFAGRDYQEKLDSEFSVNDFRYGATFRVGWRGYSLYYKQYLNNIFSTGPIENGNPYLFTIGMTFGAF